MEQERHTASLGWRASVAALALLVAALSLSAQAKTAPNLSALDLQLKPADVAPPPPSTPEVIADDAGSAQTVTSVVRDVDQARERPTPNQQAASTGPLGKLTADDNLLKELLENKTIPLFRVRMAPPF
jgi:hypothetical protein